MNGKNSISENAVFSSISAQLALEELPWQVSAQNSPWPQAAVLVALTDELEPRVLLGRRAMHLKLHPGEIAFPGGKREPEDESPWVTALRETEEEVGIARHLVIPVAELEPLITRTGFQVFPCIGIVPADPVLTVDPGEFDSVFMPLASVFADQALFRLEKMTKQGTTMYVPHYHIEDEGHSDNVWGVTAAILAQLANVAYDAGFDLQRNWDQAP
ncbi:MAG: CoA pyrophosphatase [Pseudomonadales bacterium]